jgi:uncharacterized repeat protein (TIGR04076 family)
MFPERYKVKITVLKRLFHKDLVDKYTENPTDWKPCQVFKEGESFIVSEDKPWECPPGFCGWAWADIQKIVWGMARGGPRLMITCCTDGFRPVIFKLERITDVLESR